MPEIGERAKGQDIGYRRWDSYIYVACEDCGKVRWVQLKKGKPKSVICKACANCRRRGGSPLNWQHGKAIDNKGYVQLNIRLCQQVDEFFYSMVHNGRILEHRFIMAKHLGRCLQRWELVHHKNGIKTDNHIDNLELTTNGSHMVAHNKGYQDGYRQGLLDGRDKHIQELKSRIEELEKICQ